MSETPESYNTEDDIASEQIRDFTRRHGLLRPRLSEQRYRELASVVDEETFVLSGGFDSTQSFLNLIAEGPRLVPLLIDDLERQGVWWRIQMICFFAGEVFDLPIEFPEAIRGQLDPVKATVREWWDQIGQPYYANLEPILSAGEIPNLP